MKDSADSSGGVMRLWTGEVLPEWLDYNGHMTEHRYLQAFGESSDALYELLGVDFAAAQDGAYFTLVTQIRHLAEGKLGARLWSDTEILGYDDKRLHLYHRLFDGAGRLLATGEHLTIHVRASKACSAPDNKLAKIAALFAPRHRMAVPEGAGSILTRALAHSRPGA